MSSAIRGLLGIARPCEEEGRGGRGRLAVLDAWAGRFPQQGEREGGVRGLRFFVFFWFFFVSVFGLLHGIAWRGICVFPILGRGVGLMDAGSGYI